MDVVCEKCKTEYEFDDALVSERGTTVKCTNCAHQFKIYRPASEQDTSKVWNLRRPDGTVIPFDSLAVLQKWILEGKVSKMDEISRVGENWKALGAIAELESFFATAELRASQSPSPRMTSRPASVASARPTPATGTPMRSPSKPGVPVLGGGTIRPTNGAAAPPPPPPAASTRPALKDVTPARPLKGRPDDEHAEAPAPAPAAPPPGPPPVTGATLRAPSGAGAVPPPPPPAALRAPSHHERHADLPAVHVPPPPKMPRDVARPTVDPDLPGIDDAIEPDSVRTRKVEPAARAKSPVALTKPSSLDSADRRDDSVRTRPPSARPATRSADPDARVSMPPKEGPSTMAIGLTIGVLLAGGGLAVAWYAGVFGGREPTPTIATTSAPTPGQANAALERAARAARPYTIAGFDDARDELTQALGVAPDDPALHAARAEVVAAHAEMLRQRADDLEAHAQQPGVDAAALRAEAAVLRRDATDKVERARADQESATRGVSTLPAARRAEADAMLGDVARVLGDPATAQRHFDAARGASDLSPEAATLLALGAVGQPSAMTEQLRAVIGRAPDLVRARLALARALATQGNLDAAREEIQAVLQSQPGHDSARLLAQSFATPTTIAAHTVDAGAVVTPTPVVSPVANPVPATTATNPSPNAGSTASNGPLPHDYDRLVADGDRLQNGGRTAQARERYLTALGIRATGSEAITGLGYVELDQGNVSAAISRFRQALSSNSRYSEAYIGLGEAYSHQRNYRQALSAYQMYLQINPGGTRAEMARRQIESLQEQVGGGGASTPSGGGDAPPAEGAGSANAP